MATILVTGGAGYVGSHACKALARAGHTPVTFDGLVTGWRDAVRFGPFEEGRLEDRAAIDRVMETYRPDAVLHFAALSDVAEASREPQRYWRANVGGSLNLLEAMVAAGVGRIVFSSTCAVYGNAGTAGLCEETPASPVNAYGASKLAVEHMLRDFGRVHDIRYLAFRYFNVAGADEDVEIGEHHRPETHLIPRILNAATGRAGRLIINGTDYPTRDGTCLRDYIHVGDLVDAHLRGLEYLFEDGENVALNLGTGRGATVREVVDMVRRVTGLTVDVREGARRDGDAASLVCGATRAEAALGWRPRASLADIVASAWAWQQKGDVYRC